MISISLCMIVKNEEAVLARCLDCIADLVEEIIIVDTGSSDATKEIAARYTRHVLDFPWVNDFSAARNFAYSHASMEYQMWLDADDILPEEQRDAFLSLKETLSPHVDIVTMKYHTHFDANGVPILTSTRERLTKRSKQYRWQDPVHECIPLIGNIQYSEIVIWHQKPPRVEASTRNLSIYEALEAKGHSFTPRQQYYFARELMDHGQHEKSAFYYEAFLDGEKGWVEDNIASCFNLANCYLALGKTDKILPVLLRSFQFDSPRAEICCRIGYYYKDRRVFQIALDWFQIAARLSATRSLGFVLRDYWGFIPNIESCVCCCELGQYEDAKKYNQLAGQYKPNHAAVLQNQLYLASLETEKEPRVI